MPVRQTEAAPGRTDGHAEPAYQIVLTDVSRLRLLPCSPDPKGFAPAIAGRRRPVAPEPLDRGHQILLFEPGGAILPSRAPILGAAARSDRQGRAKRGPKGPALDGREHGGTLAPIGRRMWLSPLRQTMLQLSTAQYIQVYMQ